MASVYTVTALAIVILYLGTCTWYFEASTVLARPETVLPGQPFCSTVLEWLCTSPNGIPFYSAKLLIAAQAPS